MAVTRPRKKLIIVGSRFVLNAQTTDPAFQETVSLLDSLLQSYAYVPLTEDILPRIWESHW